MILKLGSKGKKVEELQRFLGIKDDGKFGPGTESSVKKWQKENGLLDDGIVGPKTFEKISQSKSTVVVVESKSATLDINKLKGRISDSVLEQMVVVIEKYKINTPLRMAHFLAQCSHESGNFKVVEENLRYSEKGLERIFGRYFPDGLAKQYAFQPEKIANLVYGNRMGNGGASTGEGYKFRGRGYIQLTGKNNYQAFSDSMGVDFVKKPDLVATKYPLVSAAWFFNKNCLTKCDAGSSIEVIKSVTKCVNGGFNGLAHREEMFKHYYGILG
jgi:putative chitinase